MGDCVVATAACAAGGHPFAAAAACAAGGRLPRPPGLGSRATQRRRILRKRLLSRLVKGGGRAETDAEGSYTDGEIKCELNSSGGHSDQERDAGAGAVEAEGFYFKCGKEAEFEDPDGTGMTETTIVGALPWGLAGISQEEGVQLSGLCTPEPRRASEVASPVKGPPAAMVTAAVTQTDKIEEEFNAMDYVYDRAAELGPTFTVEALFEEINEALDQWIDIGVLQASEDDRVTWLIPPLLSKKKT